MSGWYQPKTAVLLHIYEFREPNWREAVIGTPKTPGRIPAAVAVALETKAELFLVFREEISSDKETKDETELTRDTLFSLIDDLREFACSFPVFNHFALGEIREIMQRIFFISDEYVARTDDEIRKALPIFKARGIERAVFVSNADHISRIAQKGCELWEGELLVATATFRPAPALYSSPQGSMKDVVVIEPPVVMALGPVNPRRLLGLRGKPQAIAEIDEALKRAGV